MHHTHQRMQTTEQPMSKTTLNGQSNRVEQTYLAWR